MASNPTNSQFTGQNVNNNPGSSNPNSGLRSQQPKGSGFVNLNQYLQANQGNQLGDSIVGGINKDVSNVNQGLQQGQQDFNNHINTNSDNLNQFTQGANNTFDKLNTNYSNLNNQYQADPNNSNYVATNYVNNDLLNPTDYQNFDTYRNYTYQGPNQLNNINQIQQNAQQVQALGNLTNSTSGRAALLGRYVNNPQYNSYQQGLDSLYLQNSQPQLQQARQQTQGLYNKTVNAESNAEAQAGLAKQSVSDFQTGLSNQLSNKQNSQLNALSALAQQYQTTQPQKIAQLQSDFKSNQLTPQELAASGLSSGTRLFNVGQDISNYVTPEFSANQQNVANVADRANLLALQKLSGAAQPGLDLSQAQYNASTPYTFNTPGFTNALRDATTNYYNAYNTAANPLYGVGYAPPSNSSLKPLAIGAGGTTAVDALAMLNTAMNSPQNQQGYHYTAQDYQNAMAPIQQVLNNINSKYGYNNVLR